MNIHRYFGGRRAVRFFTVALLSLSAHAATLTWNGGSGGLWEDSMRWLPQQVPGAGDTAVIEGTQETIVTVTGDRSVGTLVLDNPNATLRLVETTGSGATLTVANGFENRGIIELTSSEASVGRSAILTVTTGTLTNMVGGVIRVLEGGGGNRGLFADLDNRGAVELGADLSLLKDVANRGTIHIPEGLAMTFQDGITWTHQGGTITGSGTLVIPRQRGSRLELEEDFTPGAYALEAPDLTVNGPGKLFGPVEGELLIWGDWTINADVVVSGDMRINGSPAINGNLSVLPGKTLRLVETAGSDATLTVANGFENQGIIELTSEASVGRSAILTVTTGTLTNMVGGVIRVLEGGGGNRGLFADLDNRGMLLVMENTTLTLTGALLNASTGVLGGDGTFNLAGTTTTLEGTVAPGTSPGSLTISGNLPHRAESRFEAEIGGFTVGTEHDRLVLANPVTFDGTIQVVLINDFFPKKDDAFTVLSYPSHTGTFATLDNPLPERIAWEVQYGPTSAQLVVLNTAPTLADIDDQTVNELTQLTVTASATDQDLPPQTLTYSLDEAPAGMTIHPTSGQITWTPTEAQGPGEFDVTVRVTDDGTPVLGHATRFQVTVREVNVAPQLVLPAEVTADEQAELVFAVEGTDADRPANALTYELVSGPEGATFDAATREFRWTPTEAQGPGNFTATFRVTDSSPDAVNEKQLSAEGVLNIAVAEVNRRPTLADVAAQSVDEEASLTLTVTATDPDLPANDLTYSLETAPTGMTIHPATGVITWTPTEEQGPSTNEVTVRVTDNGTPALAHTTRFTVSVSEVNRPPVLGEVSDATVHAGTVFTTTLSATDPDVPVNAFTYSLVSGPEGATVSPAGRVEWTPALASAGSVADFTVRVTDDGVPPQSGDETFQVTVVGPLAILGATHTGDEWTILWRAVAGNTYRLISATALPAPEWSPVPGEVTATGDTATQTIAIHPEVFASFLRVELVE